MLRNILFVLFLTYISAPGQKPVEQDESMLVYETIIDANVDDVWKAFTTREGLESWMAPKVEIDLAIGGKIKSNYNPEGEIDDASTIENTILSYDPKRMLSMKATRFPEGFPFIEAAKKTWSVFYFSEISPAKTKLVLVGLGYSDDNQSKKMKEFFAIGNAELIEKLRASLEGRQRID